MIGQSQDGNDSLTANQLAQRHQVAVRTIWRWKAQGLIPFFQPFGPSGAVRFPADCLVPANTARVNPPRATPETVGQCKRKLSGQLPHWERNLIDKSNQNESKL